MAIVDNVFAEYRQLRQNGMSYIDALNEIDELVSTLSPEDKDTLAQQVRRYEKQLKPRYASPPAPKRPAKKPPQPQQEPPAPQSAPPPAPPPAPPRKLKKLSSSPPPPPESVDSPNPRPQRIQPAPQSAQDPSGWITCENCGKKNREKSTYCYACGHVITDVSTQTATRQFQDGTSEIYDTQYFGPDSVLLIKPRKCDIEYELMPQRETHDMTIGRTTDNTAVTPDVDLSPCNAEELGVSRLHIALRFDPVDNTLILYDLGSANGTFINGQRLQADEERILRSEDDLRLGRMIMRVHYLHPND